MTDPKDILPAIDLLMHEGRSSRIPWWLKPLDMILGTLVIFAWLSLISFLIYKIWSWV